MLPTASGKIFAPQAPDDALAGGVANATDGARAVTRRAMARFRIGPTVIRQGRPGVKPLPSTTCDAGFAVCDAGRRDRLLGAVDAAGGVARALAHLRDQGAEPIVAAQVDERGIE